MKELIIDGRSLGNCISYRSRDKYSDTTGCSFGAWVFYMEGCYSVVVEKMQIKLFTSCPALEIVLYH